MRFSVFVPDGLSSKAPVLYYLSGLTCTEENFTAKSGVQRYAAEHGMAVVAPDTSPRGEGVPDDEGWDFGQGAGFYVDATEAPWSDHYRMYSYVAEELPALIAEHFPIDPERQGITGHSMGGHGALVIGLRNRDRFRSISAFAPICAPMRCPWGEKAFSKYLGADREAWQAYDASELVRAGKIDGPILVDQGMQDEFLEVQLMPRELELAADAAGQALEVHMRRGYDHSYYFVATFIGEHVAFHAERLRS